MKNGNGVIYSLIGLMFLSIIGVYVWTFSVHETNTDKLAEVLKTVNDHIKIADIHCSKNDFVSAQVFQLANENIKEDLCEIKADLKSLLAKGK